ncbi:MAG: cyclophilin type peptidyl-prolyl cis-trans isomerase [Chitinophagaceae bacterium]|nr:MAG: cyclophilin type peptidyl-prolyl cis-trans [Chitinophagaceae bacterium]TXT33648.1 MAG: cyclophilin type peptidyl-prolyl cis-trans isomerase [Chitinophagaceae bacterium]
MKWSYKILLYCCLLIAACKSPDSKRPIIVIETEFGEIEITLYADKAPITAKAFLSYVEADYYDHAQFYRVLHFDNQPSNAPKSLLIQGGIWKTNYKQAIAVKGIPHESTQVTGIKHKTGVISLARAEPGTAGTEFFICMDDEPGLDFGGENVSDKLGYAAFGKVTKGMNIVKKIYGKKERNQYFEPPITIFSIYKK